MNRLLLLYSALFFFSSFFSQSFYNGSFETHTLNACGLNLPDSQFNGTMPNVHAFGKELMWGHPVNFVNYYYYGMTCVQDSGCHVVPPHGDWCLGLRSSFGPASDAIALELTSPLDSGSTYYLSFYLYGNTGFRNFECDLYIGESLYDSIFGIPIYTASPTYLSWKNVSFSFVAKQASSYITAKTVEGYNSWNQVDNFVISTSPIPLGIHDNAPADFFSFYPNPASTSLKLQFANDPGTYLVEILDELGSTALPKQPILSQETELDLGSLPSGFYTLRVDKGRTSVCKKLIINK